jgi:hypothetical protein
MTTPTSRLPRISGPSHTCPTAAIPTGTIVGAVVGAGAGVAAAFALGDRHLNPADMGFAGSAIGAGVGTLISHVDACGQKAHEGKNEPSFTARELSRRSSNSTRER